MGINEFLEKTFSGRWIAGPKIEDALYTTRRFNAKKISSIINYLGEMIRDRERARNTVSTYTELIKAINRENLKADITIKSTGIGLLIDYKFYFSNYEKIVEFAKKNNVFVWFDMEEFVYVDSVIKAYKSLISKANTGIAIQANLRRSQKDIEELVEKGATIRLVKGAYRTSTENSFPSRRETTHNYITIMEYLFSNAKRFTIASHDPNVISKALELHSKNKKDVTYAMLNGIRNKYAVHLASSSKKVALYLPFGTDWVAYSYRRIKGINSLKILTRSLFSNQVI